MDNERKIQDLTIQLDRAMEQIMTLEKRRTELEAKIALHVSPNPLDLTVKEQLRALRRLVPSFAIRELEHKKKKNARTGKWEKIPYVSHDFVRYALDTIFGAQNWSVILGEHEAKNVASGELIIIVPATMTVRFADGTTATRSDIGISPVRMSVDAKEEGDTDLKQTHTDAYTTAIKSAATDAWKGCARDFGNTFSPMQDRVLEGSVMAAEFEKNLQMAFGREMPERKSLKEGRDLLRGNGSNDIAPKIEQPLVDTSTQSNGLPTGGMAFMKWQDKLSITVADVTKALGMTLQAWLAEDANRTHELAAQAVLDYIDATAEKA